VTLVTLAQPGPAGPGWPTGSVIFILQGQSPPSGFTLLGTSTVRVKPSCSGNQDCDSPDVTVNVFVKQ